MPLVVEVTVPGGVCWFQTCHVKTPSYGLPEEHRRRWCVGCSKAHDGAINIVKHNKCDTVTAAAGRQLQQGCKSTRVVPIFI